MHANLQLYTAFIHIVICLKKIFVVEIKLNLKTCFCIITNEQCTDNNSQRQINWNQCAKTLKPSVMAGNNS